MKLYVLDNGTEILDKSYLVAGANSATTDCKNPDILWQEIPIHTFLIDHPHGYILFDTACDPDFRKNWPAFIEKQSPYMVSEEQLLLNRLEQLHIRPEEIRTVVMSHLHVDHAGNLSAFSNAQIYVNDEEFTTTLRQYALRQDMDVHVPSDVEHFLAAGLHFRPVLKEEAFLEIAPGVRILNLGPGHSFGMLALEVRLPNSGNFLLAADAIYLRENIEPSISPPGILYDSAGYRKTVRFLTGYAREHNCRILFGHDMEQFDTLTKSTDGYYD